MGAINSLVCLRGGLICSLFSIGACSVRGPLPPQEHQAQSVPENQNPNSAVETPCTGVCTGVRQLPNCETLPESVVSAQRVSELLATTGPASLQEETDGIAVRGFFARSPLCSQVREKQEADASGARQFSSVSSRNPGQIACCRATRVRLLGSGCY